MHNKNSNIQGSSLDVIKVIYHTMLKTIKNANVTSVIFPINISFIHIVFVLTSVPNVGEHFTKT